MTSGGSITAEPGMTAAHGEGNSEVGMVKAWIGLAILLSVGLYMFMDRQILALQMEIIRVELSLSDFQIGLVQGLSIAIFAAILGYPVAWLADRFGRRIVLGASVLVWAAAVAGCGLSANFEQLFIASVFVGAGEAGLLPITYALIPELFKGRSRNVANSVLVTGGRLASGVLIVASGFLVANVVELRPFLPDALQRLEGWRLALLATAALGPVFAILIMFVPTGSRASSMLAQREAEQLARNRAQVWPFFKPHRAGFLSFYAGLGFALFGFSAVGAFLPIAAMRKFGATPEEVGTGMGSVTVLSTLVGLAIAIGGIEIIKKRFGSAGALVVLIASYLLSGVAALSFLTASEASHLWVIFGIQLTFVMIGTMVFPTAIQDMAPAPLRARLISIVIIVNIVMSALSPPVVGMLSDLIGQGDDGLMLAMSITSALALLLSALFLGFCYRDFGEIVEAASRYELQPERA